MPRGNDAEQRTIELADIATGARVRVDVSSDAEVPPIVAAFVLRLALMVRHQEAIDEDQLQALVQQTLDEMSDDE